MEERDQRGSGGRDQDREGQGDVEDWGELEEGDLIERDVGCDGSEVESIEPEEDDGDDDDTVQNQDGWTKQLVEGGWSQEEEVTFHWVSIVTGISHVHFTIKYNH